MKKMQRCTLCGNTCLPVFLDENSLSRFWMYLFGQVAASFWLMRHRAQRRAAVPGPDCRFILQPPAATGARIQYSLFSLFGQILA